MPYGQLPGTAITANSIPATQFVAVSAPPKISNIAVTNNTYSFTGGNLSSSTGGFIRIIGTDFVSGCSVVVGDLAAGAQANVATAVSFVNTTQVNAQLPAVSAGTKSVFLVNPNGSTAIRVAAVNYS